MSESRLAVAFSSLLTLFGGLAAAGFLAWTVLRPSQIAAPGIVDVIAVGKDGLPRSLNGAASLRADEALDFHVELKAPSFLYVYRVVGDIATLESASPARTPFEPGVYAPEWNEEGAKGLRFAPGQARVYALASPIMLSTPAEWDGAALEHPQRLCAQCSTASVALTVTAPEHRPDTD
jgi:hypothetical protein